MTRLPAALTLALLLVCLASASGAGKLDIGAGASVDLGASAVDLGCSDLVVQGTLAGGQAVVSQIRHLSISSGGSIDAEASTLNVTGNWSKDAAGSFTAGSSSVNLLDGCGLTSASITGDTTFDTLSVTAAGSKSIELEAGSTQTITNDLTVLGVAGQLVNLTTSSAGVRADLYAQGGTTLDYVDVQDVGAGPGLLVFGPNSELAGNLGNVELCGDIDGNYSIEVADVTMAREFLMGVTVAGDITLCNVVGPYDPLESGADCGVDDIFVLTRFIDGHAVDAVNGCIP